MRHAASDMPCSRAYGGPQPTQGCFGRHPTLAGCRRRSNLRVAGGYEGAIRSQLRTRSPELPKYTARKFWLEPCGLAVAKQPTGAKAMHDNGSPQPGTWQRESESEYEFNFETEGEGEGEAYEAEAFEQEGPIGEAETMELASELLEVQSEEELEQFLGDLVKKV